MGLLLDYENTKSYNSIDPDFLFDLAPEKSNKLQYLIKQYILISTYRK